MNGRGRPPPIPVRLNDQQPSFVHVMPELRHEYHALGIGIKMILEGIHGREEKESLQGGALLVQGIATSIDALSVGFTIAEYDWMFAAAESLIIGIVTFGLCAAGVRLGGRIGTRLAGKAGILGGIILIGIGIEIFVTGVF